jgi:hypothetical protein
MAMKLEKRLANLQFLLQSQHLFGERNHRDVLDSNAKLFLCNKVHVCIQLKKTDISLVYSFNSETIHAWCGGNVFDFG